MRRRRLFSNKADGLDGKVLWSKKWITTLWRFQVRWMYFTPGIVHARMAVRLSPIRPNNRKNIVEPEKTFYVHGNKCTEFQRR